MLQASFVMWHVQELLEEVVARAAVAVRDLGVGGDGEGGLLVLLGCVGHGCLALQPRATAPSVMADAVTDVVTDAVTDAPAPTERPPDFIRLVACAH